MSYLRTSAGGGAASSHTSDYHHINSTIGLPSTSSILNSSAGVGAGGGAATTSIASDLRGRGAVPASTASHASAHHASTGMSFGLSSPHYVTEAEFAQLRRTFEREISYRDDAMEKMKKDLTALRERQRAGGGGGGVSAMSASSLSRLMHVGGRGGGGGEHGHQHDQTHGDDDNATAAPPPAIGADHVDYSMHSSPPKAVSHLHRHSHIGGGASPSSAFNENSNDNNYDNNDNANNNHHSNLDFAVVPTTSILQRLERLESAQLAVPPQLEAMEEKVRTIVEERMRQVTAHGQMSGVITELDAVAKRVDELQTLQGDMHAALENDVARAAPVQKQLDNITMDASLQAREVEALHASRLKLEDANVRLENELRTVKTQVMELEQSLASKFELAVQKLGSARDQIVEHTLDRRLAQERDDMSNLVRRECLRVRQELLDAQNEWRAELEATKLSNHARAQQQQQYSSPSQSHHHANAAASPSSLLDSEDASSSSNNAMMTSMVQHKLRQLDAHVNDTARQLESKLLTRVREMSEAARASLGDDISERLDAQLDHVLNTVKEDVLHALQQSSVAHGAANHQHHHRFESPHQQSQHQYHRQQENFFSEEGAGGGGGGANAGAADIILDGIDLMTRELQLERAPIFSQCVELIADCRARGKTSANDAMLLLWKFLRGHISNFNSLASLIGVLSERMETIEQSSLA